jgi:hypothetical protein
MFQIVGSWRRDHTGISVAAPRAARRAGRRIQNFFGTLSKSSAAVRLPIEPPDDPPGRTKGRKAMSSLSFLQRRLDQFAPVLVLYLAATVTLATLTL